MAVSAGAQFSLSCDPLGKIHCYTGGCGSGSRLGDIRAQSEQGTVVTVTSGRGCSGKKCLLYQTVETEELQQLDSFLESHAGSKKKKVEAWC